MWLILYAPSLGKGMSIFVYFFIRAIYKIQIYIYQPHGFACWLFLSFIMNFELAYLAIFTFSFDGLIVYIIGSKLLNLALISKPEIILILNDACLN